MLHVVPHMEEKRKVHIGVRVTEDREKEIEAKAEEEGISKSEFIRRAIQRELGDELLVDRVSNLEEIVRFLLRDKIGSPGGIISMEEKLLEKLPDED